MADEYLINMWIEFKTDSVAKRMNMMATLEKHLGLPKGTHFKIDGDDGADIYYHDTEYIPSANIREFMNDYLEDGTVLAYEYNVDEIEYRNIQHLYMGD